MAYENEKYIKNVIGTEALFIHEEKTREERIKELEEVYRKARAFDRILQVDNQATDEDRITGEYESDIETVISEYMERADDERHKNTESKYLDRFDDDNIMG